MAFPGKLLLGFIILSVVLLMVAYFCDRRHRRCGLRNDKIFLLVQRGEGGGTGQIWASAAAVEIENEDTKQDKKCGFSCWSDSRLLLRDFCTEALALVDDLRDFIDTVRNSLHGCMQQRHASEPSLGGSRSMHHVHEALVRFFTIMNVDAIHS